MGYFISYFWALKETMLLCHMTNVSHSHDSIILQFKYYLTTELLPYLKDWLIHCNYCSSLKELVCSAVFFVTFLDMLCKVFIVVQVIFLNVFNFGLCTVQFMPNR